MKNSEISDILLIGSGLSALSLALIAIESHLTVTIISKSRFNYNASAYAQGGIVSTGYNDSSELLQKDIITAGVAINNIDAVQLISHYGPKYVQDYLIDLLQVPFTTKDNTYDFTREGGHSTRRILYANDHTGFTIHQTLLSYLQQSSLITWHENAIAIDLITNTKHSSDTQSRYQEKIALGAYVLMSDKTVQKFLAHNTVLATGGIGNIYLYTSNPKNAIGDGISMASKIGCEIINAEYIQFHPTILYTTNRNDSILISEAIRGEGAQLCNKKGEYFMHKYDSRGDLAPRDIVARAIYNEMEHLNDFVYLDARNIPLDVAKRFTTIYQHCLKHNINMKHDLIPIVPAAHYFCGGIKVNQHSQTNISHLYAIGEVACTGVHGANRLASMSLLEALTYGIHAGKHIAKTYTPIQESIFYSIMNWISPQFTQPFDDLLISHDFETLQNTMWDYVGITRSQERLERALTDVSYFEHRIAQFYQTAQLTPRIIELRHAITTSKIIIQAALINQQSQGCHYREDSI